MDELIPLLKALSSGGPERAQAEKRCDELREHAVSQLASTFMQVIQSPAPEAKEVRELACVLLRQLFDPQFRHIRNQGVVDAGAVAEVKQGLINALAQEKNKQFRHKLGHCIAQVASDLPEGTDWPELLHLMAQLMAAPSPEHREIGYEILDNVTEYQCSLLATCAAQLPPALASGLQDADIAVKNAALKATCSVALEMENEGVNIQGFRALIPHILAALEPIMTQSSYDEAQEAFGTLIILTEQVPKFFREALDGIGPLLSAGIAHQEVDVSVRITAIEWATALAEKCPARFRRGAWLSAALLPALFDLVSMAPPDEGDAEWAQRPDSDESFADIRDGDEEEEALSEAAAMALDRLSRALGGKVLFKAMIPLLQAGLQHADWTRRRGALLSLAMIADGCDTYLQASLPQLMPFLVQFAMDPHPRVRYALLSCIYQLCEDVPEGPNGEPFQKLYAPLVIPALTASFGEINKAFPRLLAAAASAVTSFCDPEKCNARALGDQLDPLLRALFHLLGTADTFVKEEAMTAVAVLAQVARDGFAPYYDTFVPLAKSMLSEAASSNEGPMDMLGMKALEAFALMGEAVGRNRFRNDAHEVLRLVSVLQEPGRPIVYDPSANYIMNSTAKIGCALGSEFAPYLGSVLPQVLAAASKKVEFKVGNAALGTEATVTDSDPSNSNSNLNTQSTTTKQPERNGDQTVNVEVRGGGKFEVRVNSWEIQQREVACQSLMSYVQDLGSILGPYLPTIFPCVMGLVTPLIVPEIRIAAYLMLPKLFQIAVRGSLPQVQIQNLLNDVMQRLLICLSKESDMVDSGSDEILESLYVGTECLSSILEAVYESKGRSDWCNMEIVDEAIAPIYELTQKLMVGTIRRRIAMQEETEVLDGEDQDLLEKKEEFEQEVLNHSQEILGWLIKNKGETAVPFFQATMDPLVAPLLASGNSLELRLLGLCIYLDLLEFGGKLGAGVTPAVLPIAIEFLTSEDEDARQTGAYSIGVLAQYGGEVLDAATINKIIPMLLSLIVSSNKIQWNQAASSTIPSPPSSAYATTVPAPTTPLTSCPLSSILLIKLLPSIQANPIEPSCVRDNAISSILRLCHYRPTSFDSSRLLPIVLDWLPLNEDLREAHSCHAHIVNWIVGPDSQLLLGPNGEGLPKMIGLLANLMLKWVIGPDSQLLLGPNGEGLPKVVGLLANLMVDQRPEDERIADSRAEDDGNVEDDEDKMWTEQYVSKQTRLEIEASLAKLQHACPAEYFQQIWRSLSEEQRRALQTPTAHVFRRPPSSSSSLAPSNSLQFANGQHR